MSVITRFAPSPTGFLHIGGARTALFNWLYARHHGGRMLLRIEDTDRTRSSEAAVTAIFDGLKWLALDWDGDAVSQFAQRERHREVAERLRGEGRAYYCYCTPEELAEMRAVARAEGRSWHYDGRWRERDPSEAPAGVEPVIRLKAPLDGETVIEDRVQGRVTVSNTELDDMILLRSDGTPTYMLAVVVDDHDMNVSHVIRGDDHFTNAFRQAQLFRALEWDEPVFAHIPLIHGDDGAKMSKRHGALGVDAYRDLGFLPEAMRNYLLRLGWGHGDEEIISDSQAVEWFDLPDVGKAPARFDLPRLRNLNGHYIRIADDARLADLVRPLLEDMLARSLDDTENKRLYAALSKLKERAKTIPELAESSAFYFSDLPLDMSDKAAKALTPENRRLLAGLSIRLHNLAEWAHDALDEEVRDFADENELKLGAIAQPLRASLTGSNASPGIFDVLGVLGREESLRRIDDVAYPEDQSRK